MTSTYPDEHIIINLSGTTFIVSRNTAMSVKGSRLYNIASSVTNTQDAPLYFERPRETFEAILSYHQTAKLHMPTTVCPGLFIEELKFWGINIAEMQQCCYCKLNTFLREKKNREAFIESRDRSMLSVTKRSTNRLARIRHGLWNVLDCRGRCLASKIYLLLTSALIILTIIAMALSTLPAFSFKAVGDQERGKSSTERSPTTQLTSDYEAGPTTSLYEDCFGIFFDDHQYDSSSDDHVNMTTNTIDTHDKVMRNHTHSWNMSRIMNITPIIGLIPPEMFLSATSIKEILTHKGLSIFLIIEFIACGFFTVELVLRLLTCPRLRRYFYDVFNVIDVVVLFASYVRVGLIGVDGSQFSIKLEFLMYIQCLRILRLARLMNTIRAFQVLLFTMKASWRDLCVLLLYIMISVAFFSNLIFYIEHSDDFPSIPDAWWWSIITMTTVGYGDMAPKTAWGRVIGSVCAFSGVLMFSLVIPIFVSTFLTIYQIENSEEREKECVNKCDTEETPITVSHI